MILWAFITGLGHFSLCKTPELVRNVKENICQTVLPYDGSRGTWSNHKMMGEERSPCKIAPALILRVPVRSCGPTDVILWGNHSTLSINWSRPIGLQLFHNSALIGSNLKLNDLYKISKEYISLQEYFSV